MLPLVVCVCFALAHVLKSTCSFQVPKSDASHMHSTWYNLYSHMCAAISIPRCQKLAGAVCPAIWPLSYRPTANTPRLRAPLVIDAAIPTTQ